MPPTLTQIFVEPKDLLALEPEELAEVLIEVIPGVCQNDLFQQANLLNQCFNPHGHGGWQHSRFEVSLALAEAMNWLQVQGLIIPHADQPVFFRLTRRGLAMKSRVDVETYRLGRVLPVEMLQPRLAANVHHLFLRGQADIAVLCAFKEVEVSVRRAARLGDELVGRDLMAEAFRPEAKPGETGKGKSVGELTDTSKLRAEQEAEMLLFSGAMGYAKNPVSHRDVNHERQRAARLIIFASHLLDVVDEREAALDAR